MRRRLVRAAALALGLLIVLFGAAAGAHPLAPALLELQRLPAATPQYELLWRTSVTRARQIDVTPRLPADCAATTEPELASDGGESLSARWRLQCAALLDGRRIDVSGLASSGINVIVRVLDADGVLQQQALLDAREPGVTLSAAEARPALLLRYARLGVEHLLSGYDHLAFLAGLLLLVRPLRARMWTVSAFTLGHSLTLSMASLGWVRWNAALCEWAIAASIVVVALRLMRASSSASPVAAAQRGHGIGPVWFAAGFGLLHGLGFAGALSDVGLPPRDLPLALLAFNLGIEAAQLAVVGAVVAAGRAGLALPARALPLAAYALGGLACYWCLDRAVTLL